MFGINQVLKRSLTVKAGSTIRNGINSNLPAERLSDEVDEAIVTQTIQPGKAGQVKFRGSWWTARCSQNAVFSPGAIVHVIRRQNLTLLVE